jgi:hypothetical protein
MGCKTNCRLSTVTLYKKRLYVRIFLLIKGQSNLIKDTSHIKDFEIIMKQTVLSVGQSQFNRKSERGRQNPTK